MAESGLRQTTSGSNAAGMAQTAQLEAVRGEAAVNVSLLSRSFITNQYKHITNECNGIALGPSDRNWRPVAEHLMTVGRGGFRRCDKASS